MDSLLKVNHLNYRRSNRYNWLLNDISFQIDPGEEVLIYGEAGTGKTTLEKLITGMMKPSIGWIERKGVLAVVTQDFSLYKDLTVQENLEFTCVINDFSQDNIPKIIAMTALDSYRKVKAIDLPVGLKKLLQFACAIARDYSVLVLDEPMVGLDKNLKLLVNEIIAKVIAGGKGVLYLTSSEADLKRNTKIYQLDTTASRTMAEFAQKSTNPQSQSTGVVL
jgi:ABC-type multidrug transport system ATPase subunit